MAQSCWGRSLLRTINHYDGAVLFPLVRNWLSDTTTISMHAKLDTGTLIIFCVIVSDHPDLVTRARLQASAFDTGG